MTISLTKILPSLFHELTIGSPDPLRPTYMLNRGDLGLLASLDEISSSAASTSVVGGAPIAAHAEHLRYGLALLNRWAAGEPEPWASADWTLAWKTTSVTDAEWQALRQALRVEVEAWLKVLAEERELPTLVARWVVGSVAHVAYHLGAIRQIDRATRGPTAEDEQPYQQWTS